MYVYNSDQFVLYCLITKGISFNDKLLFSSLKLANQYIKMSCICNNLTICQIGSRVR